MPQSDQTIKVTNERATGTFPEVELISNDASSTQTYLGSPYSNAIDHLQELNKLESPMSKLEWIYMCCTTEVIKEISAFWKDHDIPKSMLSIDTDNLQGIIIFIVSRLRNP